MGAKEVYIICTHFAPTPSWRQETPNCMNTGVLTHVVADCISFATTFLCSAAKVISHSFRNTPCRIYALRTGMPACPQSVRLRKLRGGCICPRQRRHAILLLPKPKPHGRCGTRRQLRPSAVRVLILFFQSRGPPMARLRKLRCGLFCPRQRRIAIHPLP